MSPERHSGKPDEDNSFLPLTGKLRPLVEQAAKQLQSLQRSRGEISPPGPCYACGTQTALATVPYEYVYEFESGIEVTIRKALPGYRCDGCNVDYLDTDTANAFLSSVAKGLAQGGDDRLTRILAASPQRFSGGGSDRELVGSSVAARRIAR